MTREAQFYQEAAKNRMILSDVRSQGDAFRAALYINRAFDLAQIYGVEGFPVQRITLHPDEIVPQVVLPPLYQVEDFLNAVYARNHLYIDRDADGIGATVLLDDDWRAKASTYVTHIREVVSKADIKLELRESILQRLNNLQSEIDRERTRLDAAVSVLLEVTDAIGKGAKNLEPAVKLTKKIIDAFAGLWKREGEPPKLPPPETLGLPDLSETGENDEK